MPERYPISAVFLITQMFYRLKMMKEIRRYILVALSLLLLFGGQANAQRTMKGQMFLDLAGHYPIGGSVNVGQYLMPGYWMAGLEELRMREYLLLGDTDAVALDIWHTKLQGSFFYRLVSTRSRALSLYGGAGVWVGLESVDPFKKLPDTIVLPGLPDHKFVFGVTPEVNMEVFMGSHFALVVGGRLPLAFLSNIRMVTAQARAGFRIAF